MEVFLYARGLWWRTTVLVQSRVPELEAAPDSYSFLTTFFRGWPSSSHFSLFVVVWLLHMRASTAAPIPEGAIDGTLLDEELVEFFMWDMSGCSGLGCRRQQKRHVAAPPPAGVQRRMGRKRQKLVGRDKGSLTEQQTKGTVTTTIQIRRKHNTNRTTQRAALPDCRCRVLTAGLTAFYVIKQIWGIRWRR